VGADGATVGAGLMPPPDDPDDGAAVPPLAPAPELDAPPLPPWLCGVVDVCELGVGVGVGAGAAALLVLLWLLPPEDAAITISSRTKPTPASAVSLRRR